MDCARVAVRNLGVLLAMIICALALACALPTVAQAEEESASSDAAAIEQLSDASAPAVPASPFEDALENDDEKLDEANRVDPTQRADNSFIYDTTIDTLFSQSSLYEGKVVQVSGEAIGDIVVEDPLGGSNCWITLTSTEVDNPATISVLMSKEHAAQIDHLGRYGVTGTILQVRGVYHQACSEHEGIPDIHATNVSVAARGYDHPDKFEIEDFIPGAVAVFIGLILMGIYYFVSERTR